jgi:Transposase DDE domain
VGKKTGKNPTDRGKIGVKRSVLIDGRGVPLAAAVDGANVHDQKLLEATLDNTPVSNVLGPRRASRNIFASTKGMPVSLSSAKSAAVITYPTFLQRASTIQNRMPSRQSPSLEGRTYSLLDQPRPATADPLGKESRKLPGLPASSIRHRRFTDSQGSRIGS